MGVINIYDSGAAASRWTVCSLDCQILSRVLYFITGCSKHHLALREPVGTMLLTVTSNEVWY
jgi:hypothetical protein